MNVIEIFEKYSKKLIHYLYEIIILLFSPKKFFWIINEEDIKITISRIFTYVVVFEIITYSLFYTVLNENLSFNQFKLLGITIIDLLLTLIYVPIFLLIRILFNINISNKIIISYSIIIKFIYLLIPISFYSLFLLFESYIFAILRGISIYLFLLLYIWLFIYIFISDFKNRIKAFLIGFVFILIVNIGSYFLLTYRTYHQISFSLLYDPIGTEVDNFRNKLIDYEKSESNLFSLDFLTFNDNNKIKSNINSFEWKKKKALYLNELNNKEKFLNDQIRISHFKTTSSFIQLKLNALIDKKILFQKIDTFFRDSLKYKNDIKLFDKNIDAYQKSHVKSVESYIIYLVKINQYDEFRESLYKIGLIMY